MNFKAQARFTGLNSSVAAQTFATANRLSVEQAGEAVLGEAVSLVAVDTGELQSSGHVEVTAAGSLGQASAHVIFDSDHAGYVEFGTGIRGSASPGAGDGPYDPNWPGMPAQPYLRPALDNPRGEVQGIFQRNYTIAAKQLNRS